MTAIDLKSIGYCDEPFKKYSDRLDAAVTPLELIEVVEEFAPLFPDAAELIRTRGMSNDEFEDFGIGLRRERRGKFAGDKFAERFAPIVCPINAVHVGQISSKLKVPFGLAFCRLVECELMDISAGVAVFKGAA